VPVIGFFLGGALTAAASARTAYLVAGAGVGIVFALAFLRLRKADWPLRAPVVVAPDEPAAAVGHGPAAS
jgi:hypothetical protein